MSKSGFSGKTHQNAHNKGQRDASQGKSRSTPHIGATSGNRMVNASYDKGYSGTNKQKRGG